jgi:cytochrome c peroxidase
MLYRLDVKMRPRRNDLDIHFQFGTAALDPLEARGFELFKDPEKGNCIACHAGTVDSHNPADWLFTDFTYDNLGIPRNAQIPDNDDPTFFDLGLCRQDGLAAKAPPDFDLESLCGAFKVPTLRNVAITAPYGHNGYFTTLRDVVRFYVTRDTNPELWYPTDAAGNVQKFDDLPPQYQANVNTEEVPYDRKLGEPPRLSDDEIDAVVAFLGTLTDR